MANLTTNNCNEDLANKFESLDLSNEECEPFKLPSVTNNNSRIENDKIQKKAVKKQDDQIKIPPIFDNKQPWKISKGKRTEKIAQEKTTFSKLDKTKKTPTKKKSQTKTSQKSMNVILEETTQKSQGNKNKNEEGPTQSVGGNIVKKNVKEERNNFQSKEEKLEYQSEDKQTPEHSTGKDERRMEKGDTKESKGPTNEKGSDNPNGEVQDLPEPTDGSDDKSSSKPVLVRKPSVQEIKQPKPTAMMVLTLVQMCLNPLMKQVADQKPKDDKISIMSLGPGEMVAQQDGIDEDEMVVEPEDLIINEGDQRVDRFFLELLLNPDVSHDICDSQGNYIRTVCNEHIIQWLEDEPGFFKVLDKTAIVALWGGTANWDNLRYNVIFCAYEYF